MVTSFSVGKRGFRFCAPTLESRGVPRWGSKMGIAFLMFLPINVKIRRYSGQGPVMQVHTRWGPDDIFSWLRSAYTGGCCCIRWSERGWLANVAFSNGWKIGSGGWLRVLFDWIGIFMEAGTGSQVQRDTTSNAILAKSFRKGLLVSSPVKRGRVWSKENGMESIMSTTGNGLTCGGSIPGHCSVRNTISPRIKGLWCILVCQRWGACGFPSRCHIQFRVVHYEETDTYCQERIFIAWSSWIPSSRS